MNILDSDHLSLMYWGEGDDAQTFRSRLAQTLPDQVAALCELLQLSPTDR